MRIKANIRLLAAIPTNLAKSSLYQLFQLVELRANVTHLWINIHCRINEQSYNTLISSFLTQNCLQSYTPDNGIYTITFLKEGFVMDLHTDD